MESFVDLKVCCLKYFGILLIIAKGRNRMMMLKKFYVAVFWSLHSEFMASEFIFYEKT